ncbi:MAG TPA: sugar porter family MFS transporter [Bryobacteraceae bacterium]|nr:sugar porter family MFS transporter [Bryobacteraceae bacterium]
MKSINFYLLRSSLVASLGGLLFGFDTAVIAGTTSALTATYGLSPLRLGITVSMALWGTVLGSILSAAPADRYGRKACLRTLGLVYIVSALGCALAWNWTALMAFRFIGGLAIGGSSVIGPMYIAEISPAASRGRMVGTFQLNVVGGILAAYLSNYLVSQVVHGDVEWRWKLGVAAAPALLFLLALFAIPESPRWLAGAGRREEAASVLRQIGEGEPDREIEYIDKSLRVQQERRHERLFQKRYRKPVLLAVAIGMFNQLSGINAILYYLNDIFEKAGFSRVSGDVQAVAIGFTNFLFTLIAMFFIDRFGRRRLLLTGAAGTAVCLAGVATIFAANRDQNMLVWLLVGFIAFFSFSQGAVIWVYLSEVFPTLVRAKGQSLGSFTHWIMNALISGIFPVLAARSGSIPFFFFAAMMVVQYIVVLRFFPETRGVKLEDMAERLAETA